MATTETTMNIGRSDNTDRTRTAIFWVAIAAAFIIGGLAYAAVSMSTDLTPRPILLDLARATALGLGVVAVFAYLLRRESDASVARILAKATTNRNATEAVLHGQDELRRAVEEKNAGVDELRRAILAASGRVSAEVAGFTQQLARQADLLEQIQTRMVESTGDLITAFEAGIVEGERRSLR